MRMLKILKKTFKRKASPKDMAIAMTRINKLKAEMKIHSRKIKSRGRGPSKRQQKRGAKLIWEYNLWVDFAEKEHHKIPDTSDEAFELFRKANK